MYIQLTWAHLRLYRVWWCIYLRRIIENVFHAITKLDWCAQCAIKEWWLLSKNEWWINMGVVFGSVAHMRNPVINKWDTIQTSSVTSTGFLFCISIQCAWEGIMARRMHVWGRSSNGAIDRILNSAIPQCICCRYSLPTEDDLQVCYTKLCTYLQSQVSSAE